MATELIFDFEVCDCLSCANAGWIPRDECGCEEDICPECGYCSACCEGHDDDDAFIGQGEDDYGD